MCPKDSVEEHEHRGFFKPLPPISCSGIAAGHCDQCPRCQWLEASCDKRGLWSRLKLDGVPRVSPLQQQAIAAEKARQKGTLHAAPAPQKRKDLWTRDDALALLDIEKQARQCAENVAAEKEATAVKRARFAERHQSTAEVVVQVTIDERDQARGAAQAATAAQSSAEAETAILEQSVQRMAKELADVEDAIAIERLRQQRAKERVRSAEAARAKVEHAAKMQSRAQEAKLAAASKRLEHEQRQVQHERSRADVSEVRCAELQEKNASLLTQLGRRDEEIRQLQHRLDESIDKGDMDDFVRSLHDLSKNDKIEQKDKTLLEHLSRRIKYKQGGKHGVRLTLSSTQIPPPVSTLLPPSASPSPPQPHPPPAPPPPYY
jgi:hypothetical protein